MLKVEAKVELLRREGSEIERALQSFQQYPAEARNKSAFNLRNAGNEDMLVKLFAT